MRKRARRIKFFWLIYRHVARKRGLSMRWSWVLSAVYAKVPPAVVKDNLSKLLGRAVEA